jgi:hypothetical protein
MIFFPWVPLLPLTLSLVLSVSVRDASSGGESLEPYTNRFLAAPSKSLRDLKVPEITPADWMNYETALVQSAQSRFLRSETIMSAADFIETNMRALGLDVQNDIFYPGPGTSGKGTRNIVGRLVGESSETVLIGAHYDDLPSEGPAPGADDNASGVATLLSIARALSGFRPKRNIVFVAFSAEEQGMVGSSHFVQSMAPSLHISASIILDQNGNPGASRSVILESVGESRENLEIMDTLASSMDPTLGEPVINFQGFGSDHVPLAQAGIPAVLVIERENMKFAKAYGHTSRDDLSNIDGSYGSGIANTVLQAAVRLSLA